MILDTVFIGLYIVFATLNRYGLAALLAFSASLGVLWISPDIPNWCFHALIALVYAPLTMMSNTRFARAAWLVMVFQYIMAWDSFLFVHVTPLYTLYPWVSSALNLYLLYTIHHTGRERGAGADSNTYIHRIFNLWPMETYQQTVSKGQGTC